MIKIITQNDPSIRDSIIRSTNNQTTVEVSSLFATDKIQRDIEDVLKQNGYFYERRKNCYANQEIDENRVVDMMYLASGYVCLVLKAPEKAANFKQKFFKDDVKYNLIYNPNDSLLIWPIIATVLKRTDNVLSVFFSKRKFSNTSKLLKRARMLTSFLTVSRSLGSYNFSSKDLLKLNATNLTDEMIMEMCEFVNARYIRDKLLKRSFVLSVLKEAAEKYGISDYESVKNRRNVFITSSVDFSKPQIFISDSLLDEIDRKLPAQPWPISIHQKVAKEMDLTDGVVRAAIKKLIRLNRRYKQFGGIVYDEKLNMICYDPQRVPEDQLECCVEMGREKILREIDKWSSAV